LYVPVYFMVKYIKQKIHVSIFSAQLFFSEWVGAVLKKGK
jgi:hypothetical protein